MRKKVHRFLVSAIPEGETFALEDKGLVRQIGKVLGLRPGEAFALFTSGGPDLICEIVSIDHSKVVAHRISAEANMTAAKRSAIAAVAIAKGATFEFVVQKLTELGVSEIVPLISSRTVKQSVRLQRLQTISDEALEQSGGSTRVVIHEPKTVPESLAAFPYPSIFFSADGTAVEPSTLRERIVFYVGPEGGWSETDEKCFADAAAMSVMLGKRTLRTETAAIVGAYTLLWS